MDNVAGAVDVPCELFSGLNTELAPSDLPEGVSPDNQDVAFLPGSVFSRPAVRKLYTGANNILKVFNKTYTMPDGTILNLILDVDGVLWRENVETAPGVLSQISQIAPGSRCLSVNAFNREYMAFSDGLHGVESPRQFDGANFDRVSQDGPGLGPSFTNVIEAAAAIANSGPGGAINIDTITPTDPVTSEVSGSGGFENQ